ncbi:MAG: ABC transporter ATP-binding protein [Oxalobacteraceae bacterium]
MAVSLEVDQLSLIYRNSGRPDTHAFGPLSFSVASGEFVSIVGPSGCGKSSLLECVAGLLRATSGEIIINAQRVSGEVPPQVGMVFQQDASFPWLTVRDNIAFGLRHGRASLPAAEIATAVDQAIAQVGLTGFEDHYPSQLSGGMRQRVSIARTLVMRPQLLLLDEPFAALDPQTRLLMGDELLELWRQSAASVLLITHSLEEAVLLSDRLLVMSARPGLLKHELRTGWPRERDAGITADPQFAKHINTLWSVLRDEAQAAMRM